MVPRVTTDGASWLTNRPPRVSRINWWPPSCTARQSVQRLGQSFQTFPVTRHDVPSILATLQRPRGPFQIPNHNTGNSAHPTEGSDDPQVARIQTNVQGDPRHQVGGRPPPTSPLWSPCQCLLARTVRCCSSAPLKRRCKGSLHVSSSDL